MNTTTLSLPDVLTRIRHLASPQARHHQSAYWIEGIRNFIQAHDANIPFDTIVLSEILLQSSLAEKLARKLHARGIPRLKLTPEQFRTISLTERASGIGAIVRQQWTPHTAPPRPGLCHLVVEHIRSPGNLGTILRTAEATGVAGILFVGPPGSHGYAQSPFVDPFDPAVVRASMGGIFHLPLTRLSYSQLAHWSHINKIPFVALSPEAQKPWTNLPTGPLAIALGEERHGLSPQLRALCKQTVSLPMSGRADSLNVSIAAGVLLYELVRRQTADLRPVPASGCPRDKLRDARSQESI